MVVVVYLNGYAQYIICRIKINEGVAISKKIKTFNRNYKSWLLKYVYLTNYTFIHIVLNACIWSFGRSLRKAEDKNVNNSISIVSRIWISKHENMYYYSGYNFPKPSSPFQKKIENRKITNF